MSIGQYHSYRFSNHLNCLVQECCCGNFDWPFWGTTALDQAYAAQLASLGRCDTLIAWVSL